MEEDGVPARAPASPPRLQQVQWFRCQENGKGPQEQMFDDADALGKGVFVARDSGLGKGTKEYASLASHEELAKLLMSQDQECCIYELIREGRPCRLNLDLEWESSSMVVTDARRVLSNFECRMRAILQEKFEVEPRIVVLEGSRVKGGATTKYSYHVLACNIVFASNCGSMKLFVEEFVSQNDSDPLFYHEGKLIVDLSVYTKNRCFRTPLSHKKDDQTRTKLQRIGGPDWEPQPFCSASELLDALVTHLPDDATVIPDPPVAALQQRSRAAASSSQADSRVPKSLPTNQEAAHMQELINEKGIKGIKVVGTKTYENGRTIFECRNDGERHCLSSPSETHTRNNPYLQVEPDGTVLHFCHASTCKAHKPFQIGRLAALEEMPQSLLLGGQNHAHSGQGPTDRLMKDPLFMSGSDQDGTPDGQMSTDASTDVQMSEPMESPADRVSTSLQMRVQTLAPAADMGTCVQMTEQTLAPAGEASTDVQMSEPTDAPPGDTSLGLQMREQTLAPAADMEGTCVQMTEQTLAPANEATTDVQMSEPTEAPADQASVAVSIGNPNPAPHQAGQGQTAVMQPNAVGASAGAGRFTWAETQYQGTQTWVFHEKPFDKMFDIELIPQMDPTCSVMTARPGRFQSGGQGKVMAGKSSSCSTYRDPPGGYLLTARRDPRSDKFRFDRYANGIVEAAQKTGGRYMDPASCALVSLVIAAASDLETAKNCLEPVCRASKDWKRGCAAAKKVVKKWLSGLGESREPLALRALQRLFVEGSNDLFREEYETYEIVKANVERQFCKIECPFHFIQLLEDGYNQDFKPVTERDLKGRMKNQYYFKYQADTPEEGGPVTSWTTVKMPFFHAWQADETIQTASQLEFDPSQPPGIERNGKFNTWTDFAAARMPSVQPEDASKLFNIYAKHCFDILGDAPGNFILDYFAHILQRPHVKTGVAVLISGPQGGGKGTIFDIFRAIVGSTHSFRTAKAKEHLFSRFSIGLKKTLLVQVDEPSCLVEIDNLLKDLATCDVMPFEEKGVQPFSLKVLSNFVVSSNDDGLVKIADGERRWVAFKCNRAHKDDHRYFRDLRESIDNPEGLRSIYQGLMKRDISRIYNMQAERVLTDYYMQCRALFLSPLLSFLSALYTRQIKLRQTFGDPKKANNAPGTGGTPTKADSPPEVDEVGREPKKPKIAPGTGGTPAKADSPPEVDEVGREPKTEADTQPKVDKFGSEHLRLLFSEFLETTGLGDPRGRNQRVFGDKMGEHVEVFKKRNGEVQNADATGSGIVKEEGAEGNKYAFDFEKLKAYLDRKNFFDENAEISVMPFPQQPSQLGGLDARRGRSKRSCP